MVNDALGGATATTDNGSDPMGGFVEFFEKVHTLCPDFLCRIWVCLSM